VSALGLNVTVAPGDDRTIEITGPDGQVWTVRATGGTGSAPAAAASVDTSAVQGIVDRWNKFAPGNNAPAVLAKGNELGYESVAPEPRQKGSEPPAYIRLVAKNTKGQRVVGFVNTASMVVNGAAARAVVKDLPGAALRKNGDVAFSVDELSTCAGALAALLAS
jgi:hypothetical protein